MKGNGKERRRFKRVNYSCEIYILTAPLHTIKCKTEDIGRGGIKVVIDENIPLRSLVGLKLYLPDAVVEPKGRVVWVLEKKSENQETTYDTGIEFYLISPEEQNYIDKFMRTIT